MRGQGPDTSRGLGMTGEKGLGWKSGWTRRIGSAGPPPARPFDGAQGERPHPGMDSRLGARQRRTFSIFDRLGGRNVESGNNFGDRI